MRIRLATAALAFAPAFAYAQSKPTLKPADYAKWESLAASVLSPNGQWFAYGVNRVNEENELRLTATGAKDNSAAAKGATDSSATAVVLYATGPVFSNDSKFLAYAIGVSPAERDRMGRERPPRPVRNSLGVRDLTSGNVETTKDITSFAFSKDGKYVAMKRYPAEGKRASDVIVQNLATGEKLNFGNVTEMAWADGPALLAMTVESEANANNLVQVYDARTSAIRSLDGSSSLYRMLAWREKSSDLAVLRTSVDRGFRDTTHVVLTWTGLGTATATAKPRQLDSATAGMRVAEHRRPLWSRDGTVIFIGLRPREAARDTGRVLLAGAPNSGPNDGPTRGPNSGPNRDTTRRDPEPVSDVQVWHTKDIRLIQAQRVQETQDLQRTLLAAWHVGKMQTPRDARADNAGRPERSEGPALVQIGTDLDEQTAILEGSKYATENDTKPYPFGEKFGRPYRDVYVVDVKTGERKKVLEKVRFTPGRSATGRKLLAFDGKDYWSYDVGTGARVNLSAKTSATFTNTDYDTPTDMIPAWGSAGWTTNDAGVIVYDEFDMWLLPADGSAGSKLTDGATDGTIYRYLPVGANPNVPGIDLTKTVYVSMFGKRSKKSGFARIVAGKLERLTYEDARVAGLRKADSTDVFAFTKERYDDSPDVYFAGADLRNPRQRTSTNPQQSNFAWGRTELIGYKSDGPKKQDLQGILYYPANYDASKKYPMIVYTYELLSQELHNYIVPSERSYYNRTAWTQNGYFVFTPDIVFRAREPGMSTVESVEPAIRAVIAKGLIDPTKVGHIGHSWGGYEAAFLPTRSRMLAASVAGAAITNMLSFMGELHWGPGNAELDHWETGQARMEVPYWEDMDAYLRNSPVAKVHELRSPVLLMTGDNDGTVYWHQAVEYYNYARRAGREDVVMLVYPTEDHGLRKKENQVDYHRRINEWFGHYLKGEPAAKWMTEGVTWADRKAALDASTRRP